MEGKKKEMLVGFLGNRDIAPGAEKPMETDMEHHMENDMESGIIIGPCSSL